MSSGSAYLAEAYVTRKEFKEKLIEKKMDSEAANIKKLKIHRLLLQVVVVCFSPMKIIFKKVHLNSTTTTPHRVPP
uniref:Uncharacterized protein n=1 Tax=Solanum tuberosum TaxID=4113 RepID=M1CMU5_SOLTU